MSKVINILVLDDEFKETVSQIESNYPNFKIYCPSENENPELLLTDRSFHSVITKIAKVERSFLDKLKNLKLLLKMGRRYMNVDVDAVREMKIPFASSPRKGPNCVAEHAMTLILALSKDLITTHSNVVTGAYRCRGLRPLLTSQKKMAFRWMENQRLQEVNGKKLGIVGMGEIGCELARRASVMGMEVFYYNRTRLIPEMETLFSVEYKPLEELLTLCDFVTLAIPQTPDTEGLIGKDQLALMKSSAYLVNVCRGSIVDEEALIRSLQYNEIAGAGLDVFVYEPLSPESLLCDLDNVILTTHMGGGTGTNKNIELTAALDEVEHIFKGNKAHVPIV